MKTMDDFAEEVGDTSFVSVRGGGTRWDLGGSLMEGTSEVVAPNGVINFKPEEMIVQVGAGTKLNTLQNDSSQTLFISSSNFKVFSLSLEEFIRA